MLTFFLSLSFSLSLQFPPHFSHLRHSALLSALESRPSVKLGLRFASKRMQAEAVGRAAQRGEVALPRGATNHRITYRDGGASDGHKTGRYRPWDEGDTLAVHV
jgi:hypothetical protein